MPPRARQALFQTRSGSRTIAGDRRGYIDKQGQVVINPSFDDARWFSDGLAEVRLGGQWGYIDKQGQTVINLQFKGTREFSEGLAAVSVDSDKRRRGRGSRGFLSKYGYIDKSGVYLGDDPRPPSP